MDKDSLSMDFDLDQQRCLNISFTRIRLKTNAEIRVIPPNCTDEMGNEGLFLVHPYRLYRFQSHPFLIACDFMT